MSNIYGYIRVSTIAQRDDRQWLAMENFGIPKECIFVDKQSGKDFDRPAYTEMMAAIKPGDTVVVKSLDRLGRNYDEMMKQLDIITKQKDAAIVVIVRTARKRWERFGRAIAEGNSIIMCATTIAGRKHKISATAEVTRSASIKSRGFSFMPFGALQTLPVRMRTSSSP